MYGNIKNLDNININLQCGYKSYKRLYSYSGIGSDIKFCNRSQGSKFCLFCKHKVNFKNWSKKWNWNYILKWKEYPFWDYAIGDSIRIPIGNMYSYQTRAFNYLYTYDDAPRRFMTPGISENKIKKLLKKGCNKNKKCICMSVVQLGTWYCPDCFILINNLAKNQGVTFHQISVTNRKELKEEALILKLSGIL